VSVADSIEERIRNRYDGLSAKLRAAADYVAGNPVDVASRSLRSVAQTTGISPSTFSRLARALGYADYEALREAGRAAVGRSIVPLTERARRLSEPAQPSTGTDMLHAVAQASRANVDCLEQTIEGPHLMEAVDALHRAGTVLLVGSQASAGLIDYLGYQAQWMAANWHVAGSNGTSTAAVLSQLGPGDVVLGMTLTPYSSRTLAALRAARNRGATTIAVTDSPDSPAMEHADHGFVVPVESPNVFFSYSAALALFETFIGLLLRRDGPQAEQRILAMAAQTRELGEHWSN